MGDSTTAGTPGWKSPVEAPPNGEGDERSQYAYWLMRAHSNWLVLNRGVNGERSDQILARFDRHVMEAKPAAVVIIAGVNDIYQGRDPAQVTDSSTRCTAAPAPAASPLLRAASFCTTRRQPSRIAGCTR